MHGKYTLRRIAMPQKKKSRRLPKLRSLMVIIFLNMVKNPTTGSHQQSE
jgi:hypothetical protein